MALQTFSTVRIVPEAAATAVAAAVIVPRIMLASASFGLKRHTQSAAIAVALMNLFCITSIPPKDTLINSSLADEHKSVFR